MLFCDSRSSFQEQHLQPCILQSKDTLGNFQAAGRWEERGLKLFKKCSFEEGR